MLAKNSSIEKLSLKENGITNEGATHLFNGLLGNKRLGYLNLDKNDLNFNDAKLTEIKNIVGATKAIVWESAKK